MSFLSYILLIILPFIVAFIAYYLITHLKIFIPTPKILNLNYKEKDIHKTYNSIKKKYSLPDIENNCIDSYIICEQRNTKFVIFKYNEFNFLSYFITCYDNDGNLLDVLRVTEESMCPYSRRINLPSKASYIGVNINILNDEVYNKTILNEITYPVITLYSFLVSIFTISLFISSYYLAVLIATKYCTNIRRLELYKGVLIIIILVLSLVAYITSFLILHFKKKKGGFYGRK